MSDLTTGRREIACKSVAGVKELWFTTFVDYDWQAIIGYRNMLITDFPTTLMFEYRGQNKQFTETKGEDNSYEQEIVIRLHDQNATSVSQLGLLTEKKIRAIVVDYTGRIKVAGLHNGLEAELSVNSGGAKGDFNGYDLKLTGLEELQAPFIASFPGSGFEKEGVVLDCLLGSSDRPGSLSDKTSSCNIVQ